MTYWLIVNTEICLKQRLKKNCYLWSNCSINWRDWFNDARSNQKMLIHQSKLQIIGGYSHHHHRVEEVRRFKGTASCEKLAPLPERWGCAGWITALSAANPIPNDALHLTNHHTVVTYPCVALHLHSKMTHRCLLLLITLTYYQQVKRFDLTCCSNFVFKLPVHTGSVSLLHCVNLLLLVVPF